MGLVMICPQCQAKVLLQCQNCPYCQSDLRDVPQDQRRYTFGQPGPFTPPPAPEPVSEPAPGPKPAKVLEGKPKPVPTSDVKIRRPHVRRYAAPPVAESHPVAAKADLSAEPDVKIRRPHVKRYAAPPVAQTHPVAAKPGKKAESKPAAKKTKKATAAGKKKK